MTPLGLPRSPDPTAVPFGSFLGPWPERVELRAELLESVDCGGYVREKVSYAVGVEERVSAYVCVPKGIETPRPAVFCHHQHAGAFHLGKSEVVGLAGDPDQAYAHELAELGFVTIAPDAIGFEERNWSADGRSNVVWFELATKLVQGRTLLASCLHEVSVAVDHLCYPGRSRPGADRVHRTLLRWSDGVVGSRLRHAHHRLGLALRVHSLPVLVHHGQRGAGRVRGSGVRHGA